MSVKASVSISEQQELLARRLVEEGRFSSISAVVQYGLELVREETEQKDADLTALRALLAERQAGEFLDMEESDRHLEELIAQKRAEYGL
jgi:antitoxin ParD1/3/4